jgi:class 3 adenylate cyclase/predicted ATPase
MRCSRCGFDNPGGMKFCGQCTTPLALVCPNCHFENPPGFKFCGQCTTALVSNSAKQQSSNPATSTLKADGPAALDGERKMVTALFADIKGSMELMEDLDPEEARAIVDPALKLMIDAVHRYDGHIVQSTGDGVFALFGAPVAHEDHPQRALYAALRIQEDIRRYGDRMRSKGQAPLQVRIGANVGEVVVRSIQTGERQAEYTPIGHSISLASRLQTLANPGSIAISEGLRKLVEGYFTLKALGPARIKGSSEPVNVYEVVGLGPLRTRLQRVAAGRGLTKFVGREHEMEAMRHAAELARNGHGQIVAAIGEPGVGKSRLLYEFKATSQSGWMVLETISVSHGKASAYLLIIDLLRNYFEFSPEDDERKRREKVAGRIAILDRSLEDTLPYIYGLLGIVEAHDPLRQMDGQIRKRRTYEGIKRILLRESLNQPLMVIFEDLHWMDVESEATLNLLADSIGTARILLLVNYRPEYRHAWTNKSYYTQLRLDPLGRVNIEQMLDALLAPPLVLSFTGEGKGDGADLAPLKRLITERSGGNPFFTEEIVQALFEDGVLARNGAVRLVKSLSQMKVPTTVQGVLASRIDRLAPANKELLQSLSVMGREFSVSLAGRVVGGSEADLKERLAALQLAEFIYEQPAVSDVEYIFKHALTHEVAYNSILAERRRAIHEKTATVIEELFKERLEDHSAELTHHFLRSGNAAKAIRYAESAAGQAVNRGAYFEASNLIEASLRLLDRLAGGSERVAAEFALRRIENTVTFALLGAGSPERERAVRRMCELGERIGEKRQLLLGLTELCHLHFVRGEAREGLELAIRCLRVAEETHEPQTLAVSAHHVALLAHSCGNLRQAVSHSQDALCYARGAHVDVLQIGLLFNTAVPLVLSRDLHLLGQVGEALRVAEQRLRYARESKHRFSLGYALSVPDVRYYRRQPEIVLAQANESIVLSEENGFTVWLAWARFSRGWAFAELGQLAQGVVEMEAAIANLHHIGGSPDLRYAIALLAYGYARMGQTQKALAMLNEALERIKRTGEKLEHAEMLRLKGEVLLMSDPSETAEAEKCFRQALDVARAQESKWWELRATTSLARLLRDTNRPEEARAILGGIYGWFTEGFDLPDLKEAKTLLDDL